LKAADDTEPEVLAYHFSQAGEDAQASHYFALAGEQSAKALAFNRAAEHFRLALAGCPETDSRRKGWLLSHAAALANAGLGQKSAAAFAEAGKLCSGTEALFCQQRAAEQLVRCGQIDEGMVALRSVLVGAGIALPATERAIYRSLFWMRLRLWWRGFRFRERPGGLVSAKELLRIEICRWASSVIRLSDVLLGGWFHSLGLLLSLRAGDAQGIAQGLARESLIPTVFGQLTSDRIEHLHKLGLEVTNWIANPEERVHTVAVLHLYRMIGYHVLGDARHALSVVPAATDSLQASTSPSVAYQRSTLRMFEGAVLLCLGEVRRFREVFEQSYQELVEVGNLHGQVTFPLVSRAYQLPLIADSSQDARELVRNAIGLWTHSGVYQQHLWAWIGEMEILLYEGHGRKAWELCRERWDTVARARNVMLAVTHAFALWTRARGVVACAAELDSRESAERPALLREVRRLGREIERKGIPMNAPPLGWSILAAVAHLEGDDRNALQYLERAEKHFTLEGWMLHAASLMYRRGQLVGGDAGRVLIEKAEAELTAREVRNPARFIGIYAPGFRC
jgi:hypothetical protein